MDDSGTVVQLSDVRRETSTSTGNAATTAPTGHVDTSSTGSQPTNYTQPRTSDPDGIGWQIKAIWVALGILLTWLGTLTLMFHSESKELNEKINTNHTQILSKIHESQLDLKNQISTFERRLESKLSADKKDLQNLIEKQEDEVRELQKMIYNSTPKE